MSSEVLFMVYFICPIILILYWKAWESKWVTVTLQKKSDNNNFKFPSQQHYPFYMYQVLLLSGVEPGGQTCERSAFVCMIKSYFLFYNQKGNWNSSKLFHNFTH